MYLKREKSNGRSLQFTDLRESGAPLDKKPIPGVLVMSDGNSLDPVQTPAVTIVFGVDEERERGRERERERERERDVMMCDG
jgi:hypothetical protein